MGFEPTTPTLARLCSTPELHPRSVGGVITELQKPRKRENKPDKRISHFSHFDDDRPSFPEPFPLPQPKSSCTDPHQPRSFGETDFSSRMASLS